MRVAIGKLNACEAVAPVASGAHAVHGAIGITEEYDLQLFTRRLHAWRLADGSERYWARVIGEAVWIRMLAVLKPTEIKQMQDMLERCIAGLDAQEALPDDSPEPGAMYAYLDSFSGTIAAGSNEIMRNLIAERGLNMPR